MLINFGFVPQRKSQVMPPSHWLKRVDSHWTNRNSEGESTKRKLQLKLEMRHVILIPMEILIILKVKKYEFWVVTLNIYFLGFEKSGMMSNVSSYVEAMRDSIHGTLSKESSRSKFGSQGPEFESLWFTTFLKLLLLVQIAELDCKHQKKVVNGRKIPGSNLTIICFLDSFEIKIL